MYRIYQILETLDQETLQKALSIINWLIEREKKKCTKEEWEQAAREGYAEADAFLSEVDLDYDPNFLDKLNRRD